MKLLYPDGTIVIRSSMPSRFTGIIDNKGKFYMMNGKRHRDGGLPAIVWKGDCKIYFVNGIETGEFRLKFSD
jgi:hypothetical protein